MECLEQELEQERSFSDRLLDGVSAAVSYTHLDVYKRQVVNSGTGLHLYSVLKEPVPMYPHNQKCLNELKYSLTRQIWNKYTATIKEPQMQGILQGFRVYASALRLHYA